MSVHEDDEASDVIDEQETPTFDVTATPGKLVEKVGQLKGKYNSLHLVCCVNVVSF